MTEIIALGLNLIIFIWLIVKVNSLDTSFKSIAKNLEILTQNQKTYFEEKIRGKELEAPRHIEDDDIIDKDEILNRMRNKI